jgi:hypothetical protein
MATQDSGIPRGPSGPGKALNIVGAATTVVKAGPGVLKGIVFNKAVASGVVTIYDNASAASGKLIGTITNPATLLQSQNQLTYECEMALGIVVVTSSTDDITVLYR